MPSSHSSNYCAYCGAWALEQQEGFCIPCWDDFKTKTKKEKEMKPWKRFFFEANQFFDHIENMADWTRLRAAYPHLTDERLLAAKEATYRGTRSDTERALKPNFGFRWEHDGEKTLGDFFKENGMEITPPSHPESPPESSGQPEQPPV